MTVWDSYSPDFEDAFDRFEDEIDDDDIFQDWVDKFKNWINEDRRLKGRSIIDPTMEQIRALADIAIRDYGMKDVSIQTMIPDKRYKSGYRLGYRDVVTRKNVRNPYEEKQRKLMEEKSKR